jgi:hypothetical protein
MAVCQNLVPLVNIKIAGKWMFVPLKMVLIGIDPYPCFNWIPGSSQDPAPTRGFLGCGEIEPGSGSVQLEDPTWDIHGQAPDRRWWFLSKTFIHSSTESMWIQPGRQFSHLGKSLKYPNHFESLERFIVSKTTTQILEVFPADSRRGSTSGFALDRLSVDGCCVWQLPH